MKAVFVVLASAFLFASCERIDDLLSGTEQNKIELWYSPYTSDAAPLPEDCELVRQIEKSLGITFVAVPLPSSKDEQAELIFSAAEAHSLPDIFMVNRDTLVTLLKDNHVARVDKMYDMMPTRSAQMYDAAACAASAFDGFSYGLSQSGSIDRNEGVLIRKDWLDNLGLAVPVTTVDFYNVMRAFTFNDPDRNGIDDTYGFGAYIDIRAIEEGLGCRFAPFFGAFGVEGTFNASKTNPGLNIHKPEFYTALEYVRSLSAERLIDPGWTTYSKNDFRNAWKSGRFGIMREQNAAFALEANYRAFDENFPDGEWILINPPVGPNGQSSVGAYTSGYRTYAVSRRAQELGKIQTIARLLEWMSTTGYNLVAYGVEGVNYCLDENGTVTVEGLPDPELAYTRKAAAPLLQLRNMVFYNSNKELEARYPTWYTKNGKEMSALAMLRDMQKCSWTIAVSIPGISNELKEFYEDGLRDFVSGQKMLSPTSWSEWLAEFDRLGGADWEKRSLLYAEENNLLMDKNKL